MYSSRRPQSNGFRRERKNRGTDGRKKVTDQGGMVSRKQVTIKVGDTKVRVDMVADFDGEKVLIEVKNGPYAGYTHNQRIVYPQMASPLPEMTPGMRISDYLALQKSLQPRIPITPVGSNALSVWPNGTPTIDYSFIIIRF